MPAVDRVLPLVTGEKLSREEFLRRWEALPQLKNAELIGGVVYVNSPVSSLHGAYVSLVNYWLVHYACSTPGCEAGTNRTWLMLRDAPQPDADLRVLPAYGGRSRVEGLYCEGSPELAVEVSASTTRHDLGVKLDLYRRAGLCEYITLLIDEVQVIWRRLVHQSYAIVQPDRDGILRSAIFPGLWLDAGALLNHQSTRVMEVLEQGLKSPEREEFVRALAARKRS